MEMQTELMGVHMPTEEELELIGDHIMLPFILTIVEKSEKEMKSSTNVLQKLYAASAQVMMNRIHEDLVRVNKELRLRNIKVFQESKATDNLHFKYICRGYQGEYEMMRTIARSNVSVRMGQYIQSIISDLR